MMLITSLALVGWGSAAAEEVPQVTLVDGYKFVQEWKSTEIPNFKYAYQGFGMDNKFYVNNAYTRQIQAWDQNGLTSETYSSGNGMPVTRDEAGNLIMRITNPTRGLQTTNPEFRIINTQTNESKDLVLPNLPQTSSSAQFYYLGFAEGDVFSSEGGTLYFTTNRDIGVCALRIVNGEVASCQWGDIVGDDFVHQTGQGHLSIESYVSSWTDAAGQKRVLFVTRTQDPLLDLAANGDGSQYATTPIAAGSSDAFKNLDHTAGTGNSNGYQMFSMAGKNYILVPMQPSFLDGFTIAEVHDDNTFTVVAQHVNEIPQLDPDGNDHYDFEANRSNWLNAEAKGPNSCYIYQYFPGGYFARYIFSTDETTLADIVNDGEVGESYTIADNILGVYIAENEPNKVYAKDLGKHRNPSVKGEGEIDYVRETAKLQGSDWDQSNWVLLQFATADEAQKFAGRWYSNFDAPAAKVIKGGTLTGTLTNKLNPTMQVTSYTVPTEADEYSVNNYVTCNFMTPNVQTSPTGAHAGKKYFFIEPKAQEFVKVNWATYDDEDKFHFLLEEADGTVNAANLKGGFKVNWELYPGNYVEDFAAGNTYNFHAIVRYVAAASQGPRRAEGDVVEGNYVVYPLEGGDNLITAIDGVNVDREVVSVTYVNLMGMQSAEPFVGINLVVTRYSDGTVKTCKLVK